MVMENLARVELLKLAYQIKKDNDPDFLGLSLDEIFKLLIQLLKYATT